ncbi:MAG: trp RNA-binding attenuation protein MtrB [Firmicutes bacterium]|jgi:transcription attenuation protein (tryptophan RNA-binding attenuator protein)|nr:trp RNA-binding attenuation protein MtrB [Bacillota bacterium]
MKESFLDSFKKILRGGIKVNGGNYTHGKYITIKALENGVTIIGLTRGKETKFHHTEKLDKGEIMIAQFTEHTSAIKIRGRAKILTEQGDVESGDI